ncbi:MAG: 50S ribosomal protein L4 [bacterium]|nr:50S ribosomal protein L4 [bacterium]
MKYSVYNQQGEKVGETLLPKEIFSLKINQDLLWQVARSQAANARQGSAHTKTRGEVRGGGKKPWRQKGTGRARHASTRSPLWRGGGTVFGPNKDKNYKQKINKKMQRLALLMVLSSKVKSNELVVLDGLSLTETKTKIMAQIINNLKSKIKELTVGKILLVLPEKNDKIIRASKNIPRLETIEARNINVLKLFSCKNLLLTKETISAFKKIFLKDETAETEE